MAKKYTTENFVEMAQEAHGDKYNYSLVVYKGSEEKVNILCDIHGIFSQTPKNHMRGRGCHECALIKAAESRKKTLQEFIDKATIIHNNKYDYSLSIYAGNNKNLTIVCPEHGPFLQTPEVHGRGGGCWECSKRGIGLANSSNLERFVEKAKVLHHNFYIYDKSIYNGAFEKLTITCPIHGDFSQSADNHLSGNGCGNCASLKISIANTLTQEEFELKANLIHENKYDYSRSKYSGYGSEIIIICPSHGEFSKKAYNHLAGTGCPKCFSERRCSSGETFIINLLEDNKIDFEFQKSFEDCRNPETKRPLFFDFYISSLKTIIEYDGKQHFEPVKYWGGLEAFQKVRERDEIKNLYCLKSNLKLIRISYSEDILEVLRKEGFLFT